MKTRFAASLVLAALAAVPMHAAPVWVPISGLQDAAGRTLATKVWISNYAGETKSYSSVFRQTDGVVADEALQGDVPGERAVFFNKASTREQTGLLEIEAADLRVDAWIQTSRGRQTFITRVPVISADVQTEGGATAFLNGLDRNLTKIGLVNLGAEAARCDVDFLGADGNLAAASATVVVTAGTLQQFDDALGVLPADHAVTAQVSCSQAFYAYAVAVNKGTSEVSFATPESAMALKAALKTAAKAAKTTIDSKGTITFNAPGLLHKASKQNEKGTIRIPVPQALTLRQMTVDWDVTPGPWSTKNRAGAHALIWLYRGKFRSNTVANVNFYGPNKNFMKVNQNIDLPQGANTNASGNMTLQQGKVFHYHYVYDMASKSIVVIVSQAGHTLRTVRLPASAANGTLIVPAGGMISEFGHYSTQKGPEVPTWGWSYSNLRVEMVQK